jgi:hypothetical protein
MKVVIWARMQIERDTPLGRGISLGFTLYEHRRKARRKLRLE